MNTKVHQLVLVSQCMRHFEIHSQATLCSLGPSYIGCNHVGLNSRSLGTTLCHLLNFTFGFSQESKEMVHVNVSGKLVGSV